jgi:DNA processing protein
VASTPDAPEPAREALPFWLALLRGPRSGRNRLLELLREFQGPREILETRPSSLAGAGLHPAFVAYIRTPDWSGVEKDLQWLSVDGNRLLTVSEPGYPSRLREIPDPPLGLYVRGDLDVLAVPQLAMVGSRNPTATGRETAFAFAKSLAGCGLGITSGLATGIDAASHQGALAAGGVTVAVTGCGLDRTYPPRHRDLAERIAREGALLSEFPIGVAPRKEHFPRRNRIISGLSCGVLVVEAAARSGSLITARLAAEQGREVFAIPGSIHNPMARGCHALLRQGAKLVEFTDDVLEEIVPAAVGNVPGAGVEPADDAIANLDNEYQALLEALAYEPIAVDSLVRRTGLTADVLSSMLLTLELRGFVTSVAGGFYARTLKSEPT